MKENKLHIVKQPFIPYRAMHCPTYQERTANYDYSVFPLSDILKIDWEREVAIVQNNNLCPCGSGKAHTDCHPEVHPDSLIMAVWQRNTILANTLDNEYIQQKVKPICEKTCHDCCDYYFYITAAEYFAMKFYLIALHTKLFQEAVRQGSLMYRELKEQYPAEYTRLEAVNIETDSNDHRILERFSMCPFFCKDKEGCSVYPMRPLICQMFGTSYIYGYCNKIAKACKGLFSKKESLGKIKKHMLGIQFNKDILHRDIDYHVFAPENIGGGQVLTMMERPYPLLYWLAHDVMYSAQYQYAVSKSKHDYWGSILMKDSV